eukprot:6031314-Pleurochrysis_carterae.AAC.1
MLPISPAVPRGNRGRPLQKVPIQSPSRTRGAHQCRPPRPKRLRRNRARRHGALPTPLNASFATRPDPSPKPGHT